VLWVHFEKDVPGDRWFWAQDFPPCSTARIHCLFDRMTEA
jgi:hypothetical protein